MVPLHYWSHFRMMVVLTKHPIDITYPIRNCQCLFCVVPINRNPLKISGSIGVLFWSSLLKRGLNDPNLWGMYVSR